MKTLAYVPLHYGAEYLYYSLKSISHAVDEILILYTPRPSYGYITSIPNPDTKEELKAITDQFNCTWMDVNVRGEGNHRDLATGYAAGKGYDILLAVDSDEVWSPETVEQAINEAYHGGKRRYGVSHQGWHHFYRSFNEVCRDGFEPIRLINLHARNNEQGTVKGTVYHFGYANCEKLQEYKMSIHGHKGEIKSTWFTEKWLNYQRGKTTHLHPASNDIWQETQEFDKTQLPDLLKVHPYYNMQMIK